eukprot:TRINITY_DN67856_c2_g1_i10.p1 TRINITY_DN67856_c2_g1~~TRINITY_DN67856_c2_g1_i10.p1  ORF type:complete len:372 (-),score=238.24 TRINITY_DN67856_c2_g1_i10:153-1268(-)
MGMCQSSGSTPESKEARKRNKALERELRDQHNKESSVHKLLLLGAGESGKSTLFKQMVSIYGKGFNEEDRAGFKTIIHNNIITSMKTVLIHMETLPKKHPNLDIPAMEGENAELRQSLLNTRDDEEIDMKLAETIATLWQHDSVQITFANRAKFQLNDSAKYYFDKVREVGAPSYLPSEQDVLRSRVRTTGIVEEHFLIEDNEFAVFDVGGQRNERKKWIHCFEDVTAVIFVAALSEYDQVLFEDENTNRLDEALNLFDEICNSRWFKKTAMILFLNKRDLFEEKIHKVPLSEWDEAAVEIDKIEDPEDKFDNAVGFIEDIFLSKRKSQRAVYCHVTCATDSNQMKVVFNAVKDIVIRKSLEEGGLLGDDA